MQLLLLLLGGQVAGGAAEGAVALLEELQLVVVSVEHLQGMGCMRAYDGGGVIFFEFRYPPNLILKGCRRL